MRLVVDASVALKWFFQQRDDESEIDAALAILDALDGGVIRIIQPPHFMAEMAAVLIREKGDVAFQDLADLQALEWEIVEDPVIYDEAMRLAETYHHHLFDTLYHAVALQSPDAVLITADRRYFHKAVPSGSVALLGVDVPWQRV